MDLAQILSDTGVDFVSGVPDSVLAPFLHQLRTQPGLRHQIASSEGSAVALAAGHSLASGGPACVYLQNSGLPNALNPLMSLFAPGAFDVPLILIVGWRGEPGRPDEPQHRLIGAQTRAMLDMLGIPVLHLSADTTAAAVSAHLSDAIEHRHGAAILVSRGALPSTALPAQADRRLGRDSALRLILSDLATGTQVFTGVGYTSREVMALKSTGAIANLADFPVVGGMGFAAHLALGAAIAQPETPVYCLDGDGAFLMHGMGLSVAGQQPNRLRHVVLNNGCHNSVGGFETCAPGLDLSTIAQGLGYVFSRKVETRDDLAAALPGFAATAGPAFLEIVTGTATGADLPRPKETLETLKQQFLAARDATE
ncbi:phosphonopyruvate decarboxylase [Flavimaricola marinus]|uniref:Putative acetolactate synthase large subunit IlvB2 n=1 Tax=Flavimaricola marinus TaxID=1819565 RepID=A0A238LJU5_9RHOB|nr:phosphonopyruvate decarboxylase [Flavimaricola marinus]SMY09150.1 Putative acetolactate synthase large subunit IlvB2 [Flavimaricola marinus]